MDMTGQGVALTNAKRKLSTLGNFAQNNTKVANRVLNSFLQFTQVTSSKLDTSESNKQSKDVICTLKDTENPEISHDLFDATVLHVSHSTENLNGFIGNEPS